MCSIKFAESRASKNSERGSLSYSARETARDTSFASPLSWRIDEERFSHEGTERFLRNLSQEGTVIAARDLITVNFGTVWDSVDAASGSSYPAALLLVDKRRLWKKRAKNRAYILWGGKRNGR